MGPRGSCTCSVLSRWSCAPKSRCGEVSSSSSPRKPRSFSQMSRKAGSMSQGHRGGWRWQETCTIQTFLQIWWCWSARYCLIWPSLPLLRQSWCGYLESKCHPMLAPRYWKLVSSSNFWPFMLISALTLSGLLVKILLVSVLTFIPYVLALSTSLLVISWRFTSAAVQKVDVVGES